MAPPAKKTKRGTAGIVPTKKQIKTMSNICLDHSPEVMKLHDLRQLENYHIHGVESNAKASYNCKRMLSVCGPGIKGRAKIFCNTYLEDLMIKFEDAGIPVHPSARAYFVITGSKERQIGTNNCTIYTMKARVDEDNEITFNCDHK